MLMFLFILHCLLVGVVIGTFLYFFFTKLRNNHIFEMLLSCHTQKEIAEAVNCSQQTIADNLPKMENLPKSAKPYANHLVDFDIPIYNVWKYKE